MMTMMMTTFSTGLFSREALPSRANFGFRISELGFTNDADIVFQIRNPKSHIRNQRRQTLHSAARVS
jgi:hypothetical protein